MMQTGLVDDLKYLAVLFGWNDEDKREIWAMTKTSADTQGWWVRLAKACRNGYRQTAENGYMRLTAWEAINA